MSSLSLTHPAIFVDYPEVASGVTLRVGHQPPYQDTNLSFRALADELPPKEFEEVRKTAMALRHTMTQQLLGDESKLYLVHQTHSDIVREAESAGDPKGSHQADGIVTTQPNLLIGVLVADCAGILLYDPEAKVIAAVHSGWRGTKANIVSKAITLMQAKGADPTRLRVYISPVACPHHYEVGPKFREYFDDRFLPVINGKVCFDNHAALQAQLRSLGVQHIELDTRCTVEESTLHSYRGDGLLSGRFLVAIGLKG